MAEIRSSVSLTASPAKVWATIGNFNGLHRWHPWVKNSVMEPVASGMARRVTVDGGAAGHRELIEPLAFFDASARTWAYTIEAGPGVPYRTYEGRVQVLPGDEAGTARVEYVGHLEVVPGVSETDAIARVREFYGAGFANLQAIFSS